VAEAYLRGRQAALVAGLLFLSTLMGYVARSSISVALPYISEDYGWTQSEQGYLGGLLLGIFLVGYGLSNIFLSPLIDRFGPRRMLTAAIVIWSIITFFTGLLGLIFGAFLFLRFILGISQGTLFPSASKETKLRFAPGLRSRVNGLYMSSMYISNLVIGAAVLPLIAFTDWRITLYIVSGLGLLLAVPVWFFVKDDGKQDAPKSMKEAYSEIGAGLRESSRIKGFWRLTVADTAMNLAWWGLSLWLPTYLIEAKGFTTEELVWALPLIYIGGFFGIFLGSMLSDRVGRRSIITAVFSLTGAVFLGLLVMAEDQSLVVFAGFATLFCISLLPANAYTLLQGIVPARLTGSATGLLNGVSNGVGVLGPVLIGASLALTASFDVGIAVVAGAQIVAAFAILSFRRLEKGEGSGS
jgi:ACS family glucarate transporter-like MFS transporter